MAGASGTELRLRRILDATAPRAPLGAGFRRVALVITLGLAAALGVSAGPRSRPALIGTAEVGSLTVNGWMDSGDPPPPPGIAEDPLDVALVDAEVKRHLGELQACYQARLDEDPTLQGTIVIHWVVTETGEVAEQCITTETVNDPPLVACVNALVQRSTFPPAEKGAVDISYPFVFSARAPG